MRKWCWLGPLFGLLLPVLAYAQDMSPKGVWSGGHGTAADGRPWFTMQMRLDEQSGRVTGEGEFKEVPHPPPGTPPGGIYSAIPWRVAVRLDGRYSAGTSDGFTTRTVELIGKGELVDATTRRPITLRYKLELGANDCCLDGTYVADQDHGPVKAGQPVTISVTRTRQ